MVGYQLLVSLFEIEERIITVLGCVLTKSREETVMGDKGGKKDKEKGQKQKQSKHVQEDKAKQNKQPKKA